MADIHRQNLEVLKGNICVFAAANSADKEFQVDAYNVGRLIGERGLNLVYGGVNAGLMREVAIGAYENGARLTGVLPYISEKSSPSNSVKRAFSEYEVDIIQTPSLPARKIKMLKLSDAVISLAGGLGTLDEIATTLERSRGIAAQGAESRLVILNTAGYYDGLKLQMERIGSEGLMQASVEECAYFAHDPGDAIGYISERLDKLTNNKDE